LAQIKMGFYVLRKILCVNPTQYSNSLLFPG